MKKKTVALLLALVLLAGGAIGGTIAWLTDETGDVVNTFTVGNVDIDLAETTTEYKMIPGNEIDKDPTVTVGDSSEPCWLFVKVVESDDLENYIDWTPAAGWNPLAGEDGVFWREAEAGDEFSVLENDKVLVLEEVTQDMMDAVTNGDATVTLTFTAYAVQKANVDSAEDAWDILFP